MAQSTSSQVIFKPAPSQCLLSWGLIILFISASPSRANDSINFVENNTPFIRSALVFDTDKKPNRTRRGIIIPIGHDHWACFDPDLLRWSAIWLTPPGKSPISLDSMAAISFPDAKAKATKPPTYFGKLLLHSPELPGASFDKLSTTDPRTNFLTDQITPIGPLPTSHGKWLGISLRGKTPVLEYQIAKTLIYETLTASKDGHIHRTLQIHPNQKPLTFRLGSDAFQTKSPNATITNDILHLPPSNLTREIHLTTSPSSSSQSIPTPQPATPIFPQPITLNNPQPTSSPPFSIRNFTLPTSPRPIRPTDIAFLPNGDALLTTLDGDIWKIKNIEAPQSTWTRIATGLYEPMAIAIDKNQNIFVLGRDQITQLIDSNNDDLIDTFRCVSDSFLQTLHTRDFATSLEILPDGSFVIAKGGIDKEGGDTFIENSTHRGSILRISSDENAIEILADGLRLPFVGLRNDGTIFASDQQGNHIPSTPIHLIKNNKPFLGFAPTNFQKTKTTTEPLLYYPYQINRSAAAFATASSKAFPDLVDTFLQISWNGRIFPIATPASGQPFSWQLPLQLPFPSLNAAPHPVSGRLYATGIGISGYIPTTTQTIGLASIGQSSSFPTPTSFNTSPDNIEITFNRPLLSSETITPTNLRLFNIKRSPSYGSGHFKWDNKPGEHNLQTTSHTLSSDRKTLHLKFDLIRKSDILHLSLNITSGANVIPLHIFSKPSHLPTATPPEIKLINSQKQKKLTPGDPAIGKTIFTQFACNGCHSLNNEKLTGPPLNSIASRSNHAQLLESVINPAAKITKDYPPSMPSFDGVIPPQDLEHLITYLLTLK